MSGSGDMQICPECGGEMSTYTDWKPHDYVSGDCLECGFGYFTQDISNNLETVNDLRENYDLKPLKELKKRNERKY